MPMIRGRAMASNEKRYRHYVHSPFRLEHQGVIVEVDENGKIVLQKNNSDDSYDEIVCSASLINRVSRMLLATRKVVYRDEPFLNKDDVDSDDE